LQPLSVLPSSLCWILWTASLWVLFTHSITPNKLVIRYRPWRLVAWFNSVFTFLQCLGWTPEPCTCQVSTLLIHWATAQTEVVCLFCLIRFISRILWVISVMLCRHSAGLSSCSDIRLHQWLYVLLTPIFYKICHRQVPGAHAYNPSYSANRDQEVKVQASPGK
jgi:hypothetical protein